MNNAPEPEPPLITCKWSKAELHLKPVKFSVIFPDATVEGDGKFFVLSEENKSLRLGIEAPVYPSPNYKLLPVSQAQADLIEEDQELPGSFFLWE